MRKQIFLDQRSPEWHEWRKNKIGSSDIAAIMGELKDPTPFTKWEEKMYNIQKEQNYAMTRGIINEPVARELFSKKFGVNYEPACFEHVYKPYMIASIDGWCDGQDPIEIKVPKASNHAIAKDGVVPPEYFSQCQHQMLVTNTQALFYVSYDPDANDLAIVLVKRDDGICDKIEKVCEDFHERILNCDPPDLTDNDYMRFEDVKGIELAIREADAQSEFWKKKYEELRKEAITQVGSRNAYLGNLRITKSIKPGNVDYKVVPELIGKNLDMYRKSPITSFRIS